MWLNDFRETPARWTADRQRHISQRPAPCAPLSAPQGCQPCQQYAQPGHGRRLARAGVQHVFGQPLRLQRPASAFPGIHVVGQPQITPHAQAPRRQHSECRQRQPPQDHTFGRHAYTAVTEHAAHTCDSHVGSRCPQRRNAVRVRPKSVGRGYEFGNLRATKFDMVRRTLCDGRSPTFRNPHAPVGH